MILTDKETYTIAFGVEFNGSCYKGWQRQQAGIKTVQEALEVAFSKVANEPIILHAAGRTDAGVHASNMVVHFTTTAQRSDHGWIRGVNTLVQNNIAIRWLTHVSSDFHARFKAKARRYRYVLLNQQYRPALLDKQVTFVHQEIDLPKMQQAVSKLLGTHNFTSFRAVACQSNQPVRTLHHAYFASVGQLIYLDIKADGFLHHMVRNIVGTCLTIGSGTEPVSWIDHLIAVQDRTEAGITAPSDGLYFVNAHYPEEYAKQLITVPTGPVWLPDEPLI